jgi:hypothetical protein
MGAGLPPDSSILPGGPRSQPSPGTFLSSLAASFKYEPKLKMFYATVHVTRVEEWCVEAESAEEARELLASGSGHLQERMPYGLFVPPPRREPGTPLPKNEPRRSGARRFGGVPQNRGTLRL